MESAWLLRLKEIFDAYIKTVEELEQNKKPGAGLFGLLPGPADDPCHDRFAAEVEGFVKSFSDSAPDSGECAAVLRYLFTAPDSWKELKSAYWMLIAVQGFGLNLIERLNPDDARTLAELYTRRYPGRERLPVQVKLLKRLKRQAS